MSRLGAIKMRERRWNNPDWVWAPREEEPDDPPIVYEKWTEEQAKIGCGLALFFLKLNTPPGWWYKYCTDQAHLCPPGSYRYVFWWTLRSYGPDEDRGPSFCQDNWQEEWEKDFAWKLDQFRSGLCGGLQEEHLW